MHLVVALPATAPLLGAATAPLLSASALSAFALRDTAAGQSISPPMLSFCIALGFSNVGLLPLAHPIYDICASRALPLAVSLGLLSASGAASAGESGGDGGGSTGALRPVLAAFGIGAVGTILGSLAAYRLCTASLLTRPAAACAAGLMGATYIGGSANFFAVATANRAAVRFPGLLPSLLAADLALMGLFLLALTAAARAPLLRRLYPEPMMGVDNKASPSSRVAIPQSSPPPPPPSPPPPLLGTSLLPASASRGWRRRLGDMGALAAATLAAAICSQAASALEAACGIPGSGIVSLCAVSTAAGAALSRRLPALAARLAVPLGDSSLLLGCLFLASVGASARLAELLAAGPAAAVFSTVVLAVHLVVMLVGVRLANRVCGAGISIAHMVIASNANVGGSGTAIAMASALGWSELVAPAAMCGALGYASATAVGLGLEALLLGGGA